MFISADTSSDSEEMSPELREVFEKAGNSRRGEACFRLSRTLTLTLS